ncbi:MAG: ATP synthase F1 subunit delta [Alphaproteobacteria bacterium]
MAETEKTSDAFADLLANPLLSAEKLAKIMAQLMLSIKAHNLTGRFIIVLALRKRLGLLPEIAALYAQKVAEARGEMKAELVTAVPLSLKHIQNISDELSKAFGKTVSLEAKENPELLGGALLRIGSQQLDSSVAGKLKRLEQKLKAA